jgi:uncharacterized protein YeeX (DUF496 family)
VIVLLLYASQLQLMSAKTKATLALLRRELNYVKSQLNISQARCELLLEENRWLRANMPAEEGSPVISLLHSSYRTS